MYKYIEYYDLLLHTLRDAGTPIYIYIYIYICVHVDQRPKYTQPFLKDNSKFEKIYIYTYISFQAMF